ncbi:MAG TPA: 3'(2'),5'-bisphosphate nucleotidase CysQ [Allosphingosinicella sp.]|nr:3'(2'),5'-bisphosphate nucleotidase CysQ [Allosphingosinicella sp.]
MVKKPLTLFNGAGRTGKLTDEELAAHLAEEAGRLLLAQRTSTLLEGAALGHVADKVANAFILTGLAEWRPGDAILSEESPDDPARLASERVWIIDPLDGTREYSEGRPDWAVHVALSVGGAPGIGAVALPAQGRLFRSDLVRAPAPSPRARPLMLVSRTRPPAEAEEIATTLGAELVQLGSAGAKAMAVVAGEADIYYHAGGQHEWDNCAPAAVALAAGLHASRLDGSPLVYNRADTCAPDLVIARPELAARILGLCRQR